MRQRKYGDRSEANRVGGFARAKALTPERRVEIAVEARSAVTNPGRKKSPPQPAVPVPVKPAMSDAEFIEHCRTVYDSRGSYDKEDLPRLLELAGKESSRIGNYLCELAEARTAVRVLEAQGNRATDAQGAGNETPV